MVHSSMTRDDLKRAAAALCWRITHRMARNRRDMYGGATGLRIATFHETGSTELQLLDRLCDACLDHMAPGTPDDAAALAEGRYADLRRDRLLMTFDDGDASNFQAAVRLADRGLRGIFFVVPSWINRTVEQYLAHHESHGVKAHDLAGPFGRQRRALTTAQLREMAAMGHCIAAHNHAHRSLGDLHDPANITYETDRAVETLSELLGTPCMDFALAFGQPEDASPPAVKHLLTKPWRIYACSRGLNAPGLSPRFLLRHGVFYDQPFRFTLACLRGAGDHLQTAKTRHWLDTTGTLPRTAAHPTA